VTSIDIRRPPLKSKGEEKLWEYSKTETNVAHHSLRGFEELLFVKDLRHSVEHGMELEWVSLGAGTSCSIL